MERPKKEQEIEQARARSHAAKAVHRRSKEIAPQCQQTLVTGKEKYTVRAENWLRCHFWTGANSSVYARGMRVDPFYCIPLSQDRNIAQVIDFGMSFSTVELASLLIWRKCSTADFCSKQQHRG